ncbi:hypothetical protein M2139_000807 [Enterococcus sp. PF1-24]|uniref:MucBP domain-containing protein n=1 Tax=unclassified Enterococcus TaxID=2608891 RepID=UPI0024766B51|nr:MULTISPECIES: MucBP domain-containing protein [unclassified Enterococcus]MDH6363890.1 hypothetical protein [Enterococcus sp. PFB1-1]MDH6400924.1 hypothetical protein [Enterococcus sp. PF1-24]
MKKKSLLGLLTLVTTLTLAPTMAEAKDYNEMHRLYNPNSGEHFYTANAAEKQQLVNAGWQAEGIGWYAPLSGNAVHRLYNPNAGDHHYTLNPGEKDNLVNSGWRYEGISWYSDTNKSQPIYRAYNPNAQTGTHNYTAKNAEQNSLLAAGWNNEGIAWYGIKDEATEAPKVRTTLTIKYLDEQNKEIKTATTDTRTEGTTKTYSAPTITGYQVSGSTTQKVTFTKKDQTITFRYKKNATEVQKYTVTTEYKDTTGKKIQNSTEQSVEKGKAYTAKAPTISGYTLQGNSSQTLNNITSNKTIVFTYKKNDPAKVYSTLTIKYVDEQNNELQPATTDRQLEGTTKSYFVPFIIGYQASGNINRKVTFTKEDQTLTIQYKKISTETQTYTVTVKYQDTDGNNIKDSASATVEKGASYTATAPTISGYNLQGNSSQKLDNITNNQTIVFTYEQTSEPEKYTVTVFYESTDNQFLGFGPTVQVAPGTSFVDEAKEFAGYTLKSAETQTVTINKHTLITFLYEKEN